MVYLGILENPPKMGGDGHHMDTGRRGIVRVARRGRTRRSREGWALLVLHDYAHWLPYFQWLRFWSRLFPLAIVEPELHLWIQPLPKWLCRMGLARLARRVYMEAPSCLVLQLLAARHGTTARRIRRLLEEGRQLGPDYERQVRERSIAPRLLRGAKECGLQPRWRLAWARAERGSIRDQEWLQDPESWEPLDAFRRSVRQLKQEIRTDPPSFLPV